MISRRNFCKTVAACTGLLLNACQPLRHKKSVARVLVIGGGFAGCTVAKYITRLDPTIKVTLIAPSSHYTTCPASNWVFAGIKTLTSLTFSYRDLAAKYDITFIKDYVTAIDPSKHLVRLAGGDNLEYDRLIVSPGIDFRWESIEGYDKNTANIVPHAWKAGVQTTILQQQLQAMADGGTVVICAPPNPYRCPPAPYERASMMAYYLKQVKPKSKILIVDPKTQFAKQKLFMAGWRQHYGYGTDNSMIAWHSMPDNPVIRVDATNKTVITDFGDRYKADVLNVIPAQKAGYIAEKTGLVDDSGWCPVHHHTGESKLHADIHIIGDAASYSPLPKSAFAANAEAKICAFAVVNMLNEQDLVAPVWINACYSLITPTHGISVAMVYKLNQQGRAMPMKGAGGVSIKLDKKSLQIESQYARDSYDSITRDSFL